MTTVAAAQGIPGDPKAGKPYVGIHGGVTIMEDSKLSDPALAGISTEVQTNTGFGAGIFAGFKLMNGVRLEAEYTYRRNTLDDITGNGISLKGVGFPVDGHVDSHSFMGNAWYEPRLADKWLPYIGGGLGVSVVGAEISITAPGFGTLSSGKETDAVFAYQFGAGLGFSVTDAAVISVDYRYMATTDPTFDTTEAEYTTHNIMVGARYGF